MFLSHILAVIVGLSLLPLGMVGLSPSAWVRILSLIGFLVAAYATFKLGKLRWIWIGPTLEQMQRTQQELEAEIHRLEAALDSGASITLQQRKVLFSARLRLMRSHDKLKERISDYSSAVRQR